MKIKEQAYQLFNLGYSDLILIFELNCRLFKYINLYILLDLYKALY